ncbi:MAG: secondary thiamine-phosphate synthase enzyme YjbQ [Euryarchaeota archaeon]|nr:secondary thiamine-phosphate synthase enzyme YjbQ [Euryarchaeota archaeon]
MAIVTKHLNLHSKGETDIINITNDIAKAIEATKLKDGIVTIFVPGATGALTTIEYEPGLLKDFPAMLERIAPKGIDYEHHKRWNDGNGHSHVRASLIGPSITVPFKSQKLTLGTWQQLVFIELDTHSKSRELILQIIGE